MSCVAKKLLVVVLLISIGAPWAVLQSAAWLGMAVAYSVEEGSVTTGLSMTFDGEHPCPLCKLVKEESGNEQKGQGEAPEKQPLLKQHLFLVSDSLLVLSPQDCTEFPRAENESAVAREKIPSLPPPRGIGA